MFKSKHREITGIAKKSNSGWQIDFKKLSELTNGHKKFLAAVRRCLKENGEHSWLYNIKVFSWDVPIMPGNKKTIPWLGVAFRTANCVSYFACCTDGAEDTFVVEAHYNENFIAQMAQML